MLFNWIKDWSAEWIVAIVSLTTAFGTIIVAYIQWRVDKASIKNEMLRMDEKIDHEINKVDRKVEDIVEDFENHIKTSEVLNQKNREENRADHQLLFERLDEIKNYLITGKFRD